MGERIAIGRGLSIDADEIDIRFIRASGPGGQNVNKVSSAVQLRFDLANSPSLPEPVKARAARLAGSRLTLSGEIVLTADGLRSQGQNRDDAIARLVRLLADAAPPPRKRIATRPTLASKRRRLDAKSRRSTVKQGRQDKPGLD